VRQHGDGCIHQVYAGAALLRLLTNGGARLCKKARVGYVDADLVGAVGELADRQGVVKVLGGEWIDRHGDAVPVVRAFGQLFGQDLAVAALKVLGLALDLGRERGFKPMLHDDGVHLGAVLAGFADGLYHFALGCRAVKGQKLHQELGVLGRDTAHLDRLFKALVVRDNFAALNGADKGGLGALDYFFDAAAWAGEDGKEIYLDLVDIKRAV
jgi:hypothetical protein